MVDLYPVSVLIDELKHDDVALRIRAVSSLDVIARALKPERTCDELIPFIMADIVDDDDRILSALSQKLGEFVPLVGGPAYAHVLLPPLEELALSVEINVRQKTLEALTNLVTQMPLESIWLYFIPLISRLQEHEWYTARISVIALIEPVLKVLSDGACSQRDKSREALETDITTIALKVYNILCDDDTTMVRRAAMQVFPDIMQQLHDISGRLAPHLDRFRALCEDHQDGVRVLTVSNCVKLGSIPVPGGMFQYVKPLLRKCLTDRSWRVRCMLADAIGDLCDVYHEDVDTLLYMDGDEEGDFLICLLDDVEVEVRVASTKRLGDIAKHKKDLTLQLLPMLDRLVHDPSEQVRIALAIVLPTLATAFGSHHTAEHLMKIFLALIRDDIAEVRLNLISSVSAFAAVLGPELLRQSLIPTILELAEDRQWRIRLGIISLSPALAAQLGHDVFCSEMHQTYTKWLADPVCAVRQGAAKCVRDLIEVLGAKNCIAFVKPIMTEQSALSSYLSRIAVLLTVASLAERISEQEVLEHLMPLVDNLLSDPVPNVRLNIARTLRRISVQHRSITMRERCMAILKKLNADADDDVRYIAQGSLDELAENM